MTAMDVLRRLKNRVLPMGPAMRRLPLGMARGIRLEIDFRHHTRLYLGLYETELAPHLRRLCRPGDDCFDVGGQLGYDALVLAKLSGGRVLSFECDEECVERMKVNFAANPDLAPRVQARQALVAAATDPARGALALDDAAFGEGGFVPGFVKIDVEGGEADALHGAARLLSEARPRLVVEVHSPGVERECRTTLEERGYAVQVVGQRRFMPDVRPGAHNRWLIAEPE